MKNNRRFVLALSGLLLQTPKGGSVLDIVEVTAKAAFGLAALAAAAQGWALRKTTTAERGLLVLSGLLLVFPSLLEAAAEAVTGRDISYTATAGLVIGVIVIVKQLVLPVPSSISMAGRQ